MKIEQTNWNATVFNKYISFILAKDSMDSISFQNRQKTWKYIYVDHIINNYGYFHDNYLQTYRFEIEVRKKKRCYISPIKCIMMMSCIMAIIILMIMMVGQG